MRYRSKPQIECTRCGNQQFERFQWFRDDDYYELLHEYFELQVRLKEEIRARARAQREAMYATWEAESLRGLQEHLYPLAMKHLEILIALAPEEPEKALADGE